MSDDTSTAGHRDSPRHPVRWHDGKILLIDQTELPGRVEILHITSVEELVSAIQRLAVRGAPALGVAGAYGVALAVSLFKEGDAELTAAISQLRRARPTAVNLAAMVDRASRQIPRGFEAVLSEADAIRDEELEASRKMGDLGADLVSSLVNKPRRCGMTICNTGSLATVERGTALAVLQTLHERNALSSVVACETRPLLQGSRLTMWELAQAGVPGDLIVDSAGPALIAQGKIDFVVVGADRIALNGDTANKIGTYALALGAARSGIPFIVVAPESTIDPHIDDGSDIDIEIRDPSEVSAVHGIQIAPEGASCINPAFDVTPADLITAVVTERRAVRVGSGETLGRIEEPR